VRLNHAQLLALIDGLDWTKDEGATGGGEAPVLTDKTVAASLIVASRRSTRSPGR
jgi:hypothetical protein